MSDVPNSAYDPTAPEGDAGAHSQYVTRKDVRVIAIIIVLLAIVSWPVYGLLVKNAHRSTCRSNLSAISEAVNQYASMHDERFPPIMRVGNNGEPGLGADGYPYTWASDLSDFMSKRGSFLCPEADPSEVTMVEGRGKTIPLTYGMYQPYGGFLRTIVPNPDQTVLIVETSNHGSKGSFDPLPYKSAEGQDVRWDGFVVCWNNTNIGPDKSSTLVTRLAFPGTDGGKFEKKGDTRHDGGILAISASGAALPGLKPSDAVVQIRGGLPSGLWEAPASSASSR